jgi:Sulfotransferase family
VPEAEASRAPPPRDLADEAMLARAHERFAGERRRSHTAGRGALPNLVLIGGLKCGTTSLHHYLNLHPDVAMSRPKELNFFIAELNWDLGRDWYVAHFDPEAPVRGETSPHYTARPRLDGVAERMHQLVPEARLIYAVRDPIDRLLSHYLHNLGGGYDARSLEEVLADERSAYVDRSRYAYQLDPYLQAFGREAIAIVAQDELRGDREGTMRSLFEFLGIDPAFTSPEFSREWETGSAKGSGGFRLMDRAVRLPGLRALDRNFDRLPEWLRWRVERIVHDPDSGEVAKPELPAGARERLQEIFAPDVARLEAIAGRRFGWLGAGA